MRNLTTEGKILVFKSLANSKIVHLSLITTVPQAIINQLNNINKTLYGTEKIQKENIQHFQTATRTVV